MLACSAVFIALFVVNYLDYIKKSQENNYIDWDVKTITAGDFTIEFDLSREFWKDWQEKVKPSFLREIDARFRDRSDAQHFRFWIAKEMETRLEQMPNLEYDEVPCVRIAVCTLAFNNAEIIELLRLRGAAIKAENWEL